jgi:hypothetical protein
MLRKVGRSSTCATSALSDQNQRKEDYPGGQFEQGLETPVEATVVTHYDQPVLVAQPVTVVGQPAYVYSQPPPRVIVVHEEKKGVDERDCCAILLGACLCSWFFAALSR